MGFSNGPEPTEDRNTPRNLEKRFIYTIVVVVWYGGGLSGVGSRIPYE